MKKTALFLVLCLLCLPSLAFAQQVEIISIEGNVYTRDHENAEWQTPGVGQILNKDTEIMTGDDGKCVIAFDAARKNTVTIEKGSSIKIENIVPGSVFLPKGRVFTLIRNIGQVGRFEVKTPTAVSGARGTGWVTEFENGATSVSVFEDNVFVAGLAADGHVVSELNIQEEYQVHIPTGGVANEPEQVSETDKREWDSNVKTIELIISDFEQKVMKEGHAVSQPMDGKKDLVRGPEDQKHMQDMVDKMKNSGNYTDDQIQKVQQAMSGDAHTMSPGDMIEVMQIMSEMGGLNPEMQSMMREMMDRQGELEHMSPDERRAAMREMEERYGIEGRFHEGDHMMPGEFHQYMAGEFGPRPDGGYQYDYQGDHFFGGFDYVWDSAIGMYVSDHLPTLTEEQYNTILQQQQQSGFECICPACHPLGDPAIYCPH